MEKKKYKKFIFWGILLIVVGISSLLFFKFYLEGKMIFSKMEEHLLEVAHDYYLENSSDLPKNNGDVSIVLLDTLYKNNWIDALYVPGKKEVCDTSSWVKVIKEDDEYKYYTYLSCGKYESKTDHVGPTIELNGDSTIVLDLNASYQELGIKSVIDDTDKTITNDKVVIDTSKVDTSKAGSYPVTYTVEDKLKNKTVVTRTVQVNHYLRQEIIAKTDETNTFKGNVDNNYVWYAGFLWRIMYLTDDDIRLVTDEAASTLKVSFQGKNYNVDEIYMLEWLNNYFKNHLNDVENIIKTGNKWKVNQIKDDSQSEEITMDIGSITIHDYNQSLVDGNTYLNQIDSYALLSLRQAYEDYMKLVVRISMRLDRLDINSKAFELQEEIEDIAVHVRPVIAIDKNSLIYGGDGTKSNPYVLTNKINESKILNEHHTGEYVEFSNLLWRIVHINENGTTRLVLNQDIFENGATQLIHVFDSNDEVVFNTEKQGNLGYFLNHEFIGRLNEDKIDFGKFDVSNYDYVLNNERLQSDYVEAKVGNIALGEMFSVQPSYMLNPVWVANGYNWHKRVNAGFILNGIVKYSEANRYHYQYYQTVVRPVINLKSDVEIISGNGTVNDPYRVK